MNTNEHIIISLGGSLIVPDEINISFIKDFVNVITEYTTKGFSFIIITGGGKIARTYSIVAKEVNSANNVDLDWIGIAATRLNAELIRVLFGDLAYFEIIMDPDHIPSTDKSVIVGGGWKPGNSSDLAAVHAAKSVNAKKLINLSNIDYAYSKDPNKFPDAVKIEKSSWEDFRNILPTEWVPGLNMPFDPIAAKEAEST